MTDIDLPDWVVEVALKAWFHGEEYEGADMSAFTEDMRTTLRAALSAWVVPVHQVATPAPDWRDINSRHLQMIQGSTATTRTLYKLRQEKPE